MRSGGIYLDNGSVGGPHLGNLSISGIWWSSRAYSNATNAYGLVFDDTTVNPSNGNYNARYYGRSLRCLVTVLDI